LWGAQAGDSPLAEYRVHSGSMLKTTSLAGKNALRLITDLERRHRWLNIVDPPRTTRTVATAASVASRLERLLPILQCPETGGALERASNDALRTVGGSRSWYLVEGRPNLFPGLNAPEVLPESHLSNASPKSALTLINEVRDGCPGLC